MNDNTPATDPWSTATDAATPDTATPATPDPWGSAGAQADAANPYDAPPPPDGSDAWLGGDAAPSGDFLAASPDAPVAVAPDGGFSISQLWDGSLPVQDWINHGLDWVVLHFRPFFHALRGPVDALLGGVEAALQWPPTLVMIAVNAAPMTTATARSMTLPRMMKSLKPLIIRVSSRSPAPAGSRSRRCGRGLRLRLR